MSGIALIGQGYMARTHAAAITALGRGDDIRWLIAPRPRADLALAPAARFSNDLDDALRDPAVEVVSICTPTPSHAEIASRALRAGKHVLLEKPVTLDPAEGEQLARLAEVAQRVLMVAQVVRFFPGYALLRSIAGGGALGRLRSVRATRALTRPSWAPWWDDESISGGVPVDFAIHDYDQANLFLGEPIAVLARQLAHEGPIEATIEYADSGIAQVLSYPYLPEGAPFSSAIELLGDQGTASHRLLLDSAPTDAVGQSEVVVATPAGVKRIPVEARDAYQLEIEYFLACVAEQRNPAESPIDSAISALRVALAVRESLRSGARVAL
ncbi:Gfo/Idh/MocA family protein [Schumannella soli]|uniref:Gfo/Idh/MocA family oxidoreductase n=1 Tax=Schumannella soli TaxID=2590779 RepID=A0A506XVP3_9MICO|nr:Gfo/Idh/MocA family oxidoreductase [Schumannella soli]TPW74246.1 Gfo/Idh/MocA family oxidoreductase [Schumannella soli]